MRIHHRSKIARFAIQSSAALVALAGAPSSLGSEIFQVRPLNLDGYVVSGTITTDGTVGSLARENILAWDIHVDLITEYRFSRANTHAQPSSVSASPAALSIPTSPDGVTDGGALAFTGFPAEVSAVLADFSGPYIAGGQAMYLMGGAFDFLDLNQPDGAQYVAATGVGAGVYELRPLTFPSGAVMTGTITTTGATGPLAPSDFVSWDIRVRETVADPFSTSTSTVDPGFAGVRVSADGLRMTVDNPDGALEFAKPPIALHRHSIQLADFTNGQNQAAYFYGRLVFAVLSPLTDGPRYRVADSPVHCPGDADGDHAVTFADLNLVLSAFALSSGQPGFIAGADFNHDGVVSFADLNIVLSAFGAAC